MGSLFDDTEPSAPDDWERSEFRPSPRSRRINGTIDFEQESLSVNLDLHECQPGSSLCATGGTMTVFAGDQPLCVISVGILQPPSDGLPPNHYRVEWHAREDGFSFADADRISTLNRLAGTAAILDRSGFLQLLRAGYADGSPEDSASTEESLEKRLIRAICTAIVRSRTPTQFE